MHDLNTTVARLLRQKVNTAPFGSRTVSIIGVPVLIEKQPHLSTVNVNGKGPWLTGVRWWDIVDAIVKVARREPVIPD